MLEAVVANTLGNLRLIERKHEQDVLSGVLGDLKRTLEVLASLAPNGEKARLAGGNPALWLHDVTALCHQVDDLFGLSEIDDINGRHRQTYLLRWFCLGYDFNSFMIYRKLKEVNDNLMRLTKEARSVGITAEVVDEPFDSWRLTSSIFDSRKVVGRQMEKRAVMNMLVKQSTDDHDHGNPRIVSIVGYVGIGKTTLAQLVYSDADIADHFEHRIWVCVSEKFDEMSIAKSIIQQVLPIYPWGSLDSRGILRELERRIAGRRFLLVLDDVWEADPDKWKRIVAALGHGSQQSRVLVTTRNQNVANALSPNDDQIFRLPELSRDDCWRLFSLFAFARWPDFDGRGCQECDVRAVLSICRGVPLIAQTLGMIIWYRKSGEPRFSFSSIDLWWLYDILDFLWPTYFHLPPALRICFAYCAALPCGFQVPDDKLMKLWMAQGYLDAESSEDPEAVGERYIEDLLMRSLLRVVPKKSDQGHADECCRVLEMPEAIHDFSRVCAASQCFSVQDPDAYDISTPVRRLLIYPSESLHLSIVDRVLCTQSSDFIQRSTRLRSLLVRSKRSSGSGVELVRKLSSFFVQLTLLKSLDLTDCSFGELPSTIGDLVLLRLLILSGNKDLEELPEEICELPKLQTLEANCCESLKMLPKGIGKLVSLRHLGYFLESRKAYLPKGIRSLNNLRTLTAFYVSRHDDDDDDESASLADLGNLNELRGKLCINGLGNLHVAANVSEARLHEKKGITALELNFQREVEEEEEESQVNNNDEFILEALQPQPDLVELTVKGYKGRCLIFPSWLVKLRSLRKISLLLCDDCESFPPLGKLACLKELDICYMPRVTTVGREFLGTEVIDDGLLAAESSSSSSSSSVVTATAFPMLTKLTIRNMLSWTEWRDDWSETALVFSKLRTLSLGDCPNLKALPEKLLRSTCLEEVELLMCPLLEKR